VSGIGRYHYEKPESASITFHNTSGLDTSTVYSYSASNASSCSQQIVVGVLSEPWLSSAPIKRWTDSTASIMHDSAGVVVVNYFDGFNTFIYSIDITRWVVIALRKNSISMTYLYADTNGFYVLRKAAFNGDTTLSVGGVEFVNSYINGQPMLGARNPRGFRGIRGPLLPLADLHRHAALFDLAGRIVMQAPGSPIPEGRALNSGLYIMRRESENSGSAAPITIFK
jgi:hypothetical protein